MKRLKVCAAVLISLTTSAPVLAETETSLVSRDPDTGATYTYRMPEYGLNLSGYEAPDYVSVSVDYLNVHDPWTSFALQFAAPRGEVFKPGRYYQTRCPQLRAGYAAGFYIRYGRDYNGCTTQYMEKIDGFIGLRQIGFDENGKLKTLEASYSLTLNGERWAGLLKYNAAPLSLDLTGPYWSEYEATEPKSYYGDDTKFSLSGHPGGLQLDASGQDDRWRFKLTPRSGQVLTPGTYQVYPVDSASQVGFSIEEITAFGERNVCTEMSGTVSIKGIETNASGSVSGLHVTYEVRCGHILPENPPMRGVIRYLL